ncbi:MAG TPA: hypothetical protein VHE55_11310 [Fimbriimonadaceae bacterium]|nr:hypothetical protein [Fimbriimonadaceae bacterium]
MLYPGSTPIAHSRLAGAVFALRSAIPFVLLAFYVLPNTLLADASPLSWSVLTRTGATDRTILTALSALCLLAAVPFLSRIRSDGLRILFGGLVAYMVAVAVSSFMSGASLAGTNDCFAILLALAVGIGSSFLSPDLKTRAATVAILIAAQAACALWLRSEGLNVVRVEHMAREGGTFDSPALLYAAIAVGLPMLIVLGSASKKTSEAGFWSLGAALALGALILTGSLTGFVAAGLASLYGLARILRKPAAIVALGLAMVCALGFFLSQSPAGTPRAATYAHTLSDRGTVAVAVLKSAKSSNWSGAGVGNSRIDVEKPTDGSPVHLGAGSPWDAYSLPVRLLSELGVAGLLIGLMLLAGILKAAGAARAPEEIAIAAGLVALAAISLVASPFGSSGNLCGTALAGFLLGSVYTFQPRREEAPAAEKPQPEPERSPMEPAEVAARS